MMGNFSIRILAHSVNPDGLEAVSWLATYERFIHAEVMTHRWSRNASSSRAIPGERMRAWTAADPAVPLHLGANQPGMRSGPEIANADQLRKEILDLHDFTSVWSEMASTLFKPHKEIVNRYIEPWGWITSVMTMGRAQLENFFALRCSPNAAPNIQRLAVTMARMFRDSKPRRLIEGEWHVPFGEQSRRIIGPPWDPVVAEALTWSVARCAWCSYNRPDKDATFADAKARHDACVNDKHVSPAEHQLRAFDGGNRGSGVVPGFASYRSMIPGEVSRFNCSILDTVYKDRDYVV